MKLIKATIEGETEMLVLRNMRLNDQDDKPSPIINQKFLNQQLRITAYQKAH